MRQIFTSQRLETVEGVARLLEEAGIGTYISHPRSYRSKRRGQFSYSEPVPANQQPAVWVRKPEDQPRARELLREAGLLATTRSYSGLPTPATQALPSRFEEGGAAARFLNDALMFATAFFSVPHIIRIVLPLPCPRWWPCADGGRR